jgi:CRP/FNR family transcriptional regulator, cyclic AMP receptor protein
VRRLPDLIAEIPFLRPLGPAAIGAIAGCGRHRVFRAGELIIREGGPANRFYVIRSGTVSLETYVAGRGPLVIETLHDGDAVGWSWLFPPHRARFDARAVDDVHTIEFDGACLRGKAEEDAELGYELMRLFGGVLVERLQHTRLRLLDVYGPVAGG